MMRVAMLVCMMTMCMSVIVRVTLEEEGTHMVNSVPWKVSGGGRHDWSFVHGDIAGH